MSEEEYQLAKAEIYDHAEQIRQNDEYADPEDAAQCYKEWALDLLDDEYYGE